MLHEDSGRLLALNAEGNTHTPHLDPFHVSPRLQQDLFFVFFRTISPSLPDDPDAQHAKHVVTQALATTDLTLRPLSSDPGASHGKCGF